MMSMRSSHSGEFEEYRVPYSTGCPVLRSMLTSSTLPYLYLALVASWSRIRVTVRCAAPLCCSCAAHSPTTGPWSDENSRMSPYQSTVA